MKKILCLDYILEECKLIETILKTEGYDIKCTDNRKECLKLLNKEKFDFVILDQRMSEMNGTELFKVIKKSWPKTKIIFITEVFNTEELESLVEKEKIQVITEPFGAREVIEAITTVLG